MPIFDDNKRRKLDEMRRQHAIESSRLTPAERMRRSDELRRMADSLRPGIRSTSDESPEVIRRWRRRGSSS